MVITIGRASERSLRIILPPDETVGFATRFFVCTDRFDAFHSRNPRRRQVLAYLQKAGETETLSELVEQIAAWENDIELRELNSDQRKCAYVGLYQAHLPKMDDAGVIDYNQDRGLITLSENADLLQEYLEQVEEGLDRWPQWYALVSGGGMVWIARAYLSVPVLSIGSTSFVSGMIVSALVLVSFVHLISSNQH